jgi:hypothetical protein
VPATCLIGWSVRGSDKEEIDSRTTVANTVAKPLDDACQAWTCLEHRPRAPTRLDGLGRLARNYGLEGRARHVPETQELVRKRKDGHRSAHNTATAGASWGSGCARSSWHWLRMGGGWRGFASLS